MEVFNFWVLKIIFRIFLVLFSILSSQVTCENSTTTHKNLKEEAWSESKTIPCVTFALIFGILFLMYIINLKSRQESQIKKLWVWNDYKLIKFNRFFCDINKTERFFRKSNKFKAKCDEILGLEHFKWFFIISGCVVKPINQFWNIFWGISTP